MMVRKISPFCMMYLVGLFFTALYSDDDVTIINTTDKPVWVYVTKKGRGGADKMAADAKTRIDTGGTFHVTGVNITDVYMLASNDKKIDDKKLRDQAEKNKLHIKYNGQKTLFFMEQNNSYAIVNGYRIKNDYPGWQDMVAQANKDGSTESNPWVGQSEHNVISLFMAIKTKGSSIGAWDIDGIVPSDYSASKSTVLFKTIADEGLGLIDRKEGLSHFQGIQRLPTWLNLGQYIMVGSGQYTNLEAHLFLVKLGSASPNQSLVGNSKSDQQRDTVIKKIVVDTYPYWHTCGLDICGKYLVAPITTWHTDKKGLFKTIIYDISKPENPVEVTKLVQKGSYSAAAMARLPNNHYLLIFNGDTIDFYYSKSTNINDGFFNSPTASIPAQGILSHNPQSINCITAGNGTLFMTASYNTKSTAPIINGEDHITLYSIDYSIKNLETNNSDLSAEKKPSISSFKTIAVHPIADKHFTCKGDYCNFAAAASVDTISRNKFDILGVYHWVKDKQIRMTIFSH